MKFNEYQKDINSLTKKYNKYDTLKAMNMHKTLLHAKNKELGLYMYTDAQDVRRAKNSRRNKNYIMVVIKNKKEKTD